VDPVPWREAWHDALYAAGRGFYVARGGPAAHFTTAAHGPTGRVLAEALLSFWPVEQGSPVPSLVVDVGAGRGELATHLLAAVDRVEPTYAAAPGRAAPHRPRMVAVDVVDRPEGLDDRIEWLRSPGGADLPDRLRGLEDVLVVAHEWLDVVPCAVAEVDDAGVLREVLVEPETGAETLGTPLGGPDLDWTERHWRPTEPGQRVEVGLARDRAWADLVSRVASGTLVAVDYGHTATARPGGGTLTAYALGGLTHPVPDGRCDLTAHVAMDTLDADVVRPQRDVLRGLGLRGATPPHSLATTHPLAYLAGLEQAGAEARLLDPDGFGAFWWAVKRVPKRDVP
jgi:SAM-dependent MidA family methyltransferase